MANAIPWTGIAYDSGVALSVVPFLMTSKILFRAQEHHAYFLCSMAALLSIALFNVRTKSTAAVHLVILSQVTHYQFYWVSTRSFFGGGYPVWYVGGAVVLLAFESYLAWAIKFTDAGTLDRSAVAASSEDMDLGANVGADGGEKKKKYSNFRMWIIQMYQDDSFKRNFHRVSNGYLLSGALIPVEGAGLFQLPWRLAALIMTAWCVLYFLEAYKFGVCRHFADASAVTPNPAAKCAMFLYLPATHWGLAGALAAWDFVFIYVVLRKEQFRFECLFRNTM